jgi:hypothetical protein
LIDPDDLHDLLHAHAASIDPIPHLAELGAGLTVVERHRRTRAVVSTTIAAFAVAAAVTAVRAIETRPSRLDTAPATQRVVITPDPAATIPSSVAALVTADVPTTAAPPATVPPAPPAPASTAPTTPARTPVTTAPARGTPTRVLTFRAASVSDLSSATPAAADYFGVAPPGSTVTATSPYGSATAQSGPDGRWSLHLAMPGAPVGQRFKVVLSAPPLPSLTFNFTHTTG